MEEIIRKWWNFAAINDKVVDLVAAEALDGGAQHLKVLNVSADSQNLDFLLALVGL